MARYGELITGANSLGFHNYAADLRAESQASALRIFSSVPVPTILHPREQTLGTRPGDIPANTRNIFNLIAAHEQLRDSRLRGRGLSAQVFLGESALNSIARNPQHREHVARIVSNNLVEVRMVPDSKYNRSAELSGYWYIGEYRNTSEAFATCATRNGSATPQWAEGARAWEATRALDEAAQIALTPQETLAAMGR